MGNSTIMQDTLHSQMGLANHYPTKQRTLGNMDIYWLLVTREYPFSPELETRSTLMMLGGTHASPLANTKRIFMFVTYD